MRYRKLLATIVLAVVSSLMLAGCTPDPQIVDDVVDYVEEIPAETGMPEQSELSETIPTTGVKAEDAEDQKLIDELNQFQDKSLEEDFSAIESQF
jgi:hypothetical protein